MQRFQVFRRLSKVVVTDNPLGGPIARNGRRDILLKIDVIGSFRDCGTEQQLPFRFRSGESPAVAFPSARHDDGTRPVLKQSLDVDRSANVIQPNLDKLSALFGQVSMFGDDMAMATAGDADANHGDVVLEGVNDAGEENDPRGVAARGRACGRCFPLSPLPILYTRLKCLSSSSRLKIRAVGRPWGQ